MVLKKLIAGTALTLAGLGSLGGVAHAGEITGQKPAQTTPIKAFNAASICSFSGLDAIDGSAADPLDADDAVFDRTQSFGQLVRGSGHAAGGAGASCRPGGE
jgi:hypothetical protein